MEDDGSEIDGHEATLKITVSDNLEGKLEVTNIASENGTFTNEYKSQLDYAAAGGLQITKALNGRDMEKDQFTFTVRRKRRKEARLRKKRRKIRTCECGKYI